MKKLFNTVIGALVALLSGMAESVHLAANRYMAKAGLVLYMDYTLDTLNQFKVNRPGATEVVRQRLYDRQIYPTAGSTQFTFFALPIGQGKTSATGATAATAKTFADTNMDQGGVLSRPKNYIIESIEVEFEPGSVSTTDTFTVLAPQVWSTTAAAALIGQVGDVNIIRISGWLELYIGSKTYLTEAPLGVFPPKVNMDLQCAIGLSGNGATTTQANALATANASFAGRPYYLDPPITLESMQNFAVYLKFPVVTATPSGFNGRIGVVFDGVMYRLSQ